MRNLWIFLAIGILTAAAWTVTAVAQGRGTVSAYPGQGEIGVTTRTVGGFFIHRGIVVTIPGQPGRQSLLFFGEPETGPAPPGMPTGEPEHVIGDHSVAPVIHLLSDPAQPVDSEKGTTPQSTSAGGAGDLDQANVANAPQNPSANPSSPRPPGARGPGRPVSGWAGPGQPGPGRPATPPR